MNHYEPERLRKLYIRNEQSYTDEPKHYDQIIMQVARWSWRRSNVLFGLARPAYARSDWDLRNLEAKETPWTLCPLPQTIPKQSVQCCRAHYPAERCHWSHNFLGRLHVRLTSICLPGARVWQQNIAIGREGGGKHAKRNKDTNQSSDLNQGPWMLRCCTMVPPKIILPKLKVNNKFSCHNKKRCGATT